jgi:hypothetical protein
VSVWREKLDVGEGLMRAGGVTRIHDSLHVIGVHKFIKAASVGIPPKKQFVCAKR